MKDDVIFAILGILFSGLAIGWLLGYNLRPKIEGADCLKSQTNAIEAGNKRIDILFCIEPDIRIIKVYK